MSDTTHYCPQCVEFSTALLQAQADLVAAVGPSEVVVSRTDLEAVLNDYFDGVFDEPGIAIAHRLRAAVLNTENQT